MLHDIAVIEHIWHVINLTHCRPRNPSMPSQFPSQSSTCLYPHTIQLWAPTYLCEWTHHVHCDTQQQLKLFHISVPVTTLQLFNTACHYQHCFLQLCMALQCISTMKNRYFHIWILCHVTDFHFLMGSLTQTLHTILVHSGTLPMVNLQVHITLFEMYILCFLHCQIKNNGYDLWHDVGMSQVHRTLRRKTPFQVSLTCSTQSTAG
jgi:hypothetical protein